LNVIWKKNFGFNGSRPFVDRSGNLRPLSSHDIDSVWVHDAATKRGRTLTDRTIYDWIQAESFDSPDFNGYTCVWNLGYLGSSDVYSPGIGASAWYTKRRVFF